MLYKNVHDGWLTIAWFRFGFEEDELLVSELDRSRSQSINICWTDFRITADSRCLNTEH